MGTPSLAFSVLPRCCSGPEEKGEEGSERTKRPEKADLQEGR